MTTVSARAVPPEPSNEPVLTYVRGSDERASLEARLAELSKETIVAPHVIGGREVPNGQTWDLRAPHDHDLHLATVHAAGRDEVTAAIDAAREAKPAWAAMDWQERAAVFLRAADLLAGPHRDTINAATMLGQSKTIQQAEIDAACELIDFLRFNVDYLARVLAEQPRNADAVWNRLDYRPLDGFVLAMTPFNFTAIAGNLPTVPAMCGNTVVWKPSEKQAYAAHFFMQTLREAGLPDGVINLVHGDGALVSDVCFDDPDFAGLHFTGSKDVFQSLWSSIGERVRTYRNFPRIVGECGGKDFIVAHETADVDTLTTAVVRGAFEYQGQKCSAASRVYVPSTLWPQLREQVAEVTRTLAIGDVADLSNFMGAVIDETAFRRHERVLADAADDPHLEVVAGGATDDREGWFVEPTVLVTDEPRHELMSTELFGPIVTVYVYEPSDWAATLELVDSTSPYALTGAVFARDRDAVQQASAALRQAAGNFYVNDKPTGSIVSQQPFGGARLSGTNDKAGAIQNVQRWLSTRSIKETFVAATDHTYPHMR